MMSGPTRRIAAAALAAGMVWWLSGCATPNADPAGLKPGASDKAVLLMSITHDWGPPAWLGTDGMGRTVQLVMSIRPAGRPDGAMRLVSHELMSWAGPTPLFDKLWGSLVVRELSPGRYELSDWYLLQNTGAGTRQFSPKQPPPQMSVDLAPGAVVYIGNVHARLVWGENLLKIPLLTAGMPEWSDQSARDLPRIFRDYPQLDGKVTRSSLPTGPWISGATP